MSHQSLVCEHEWSPWSYELRTVADYGDGRPVERTVMTHYCLRLRCGQVEDQE